MTTTTYITNGNENRYMHACIHVVTLSIYVSKCVFKYVFKYVYS